MTSEAKNRPMARTSLCIVLIAAGALSASAAVGCGGLHHPSTTDGKAAKADAAVPSGRIAFRRYLNPSHTEGAIFTVRTDGTDVRQLTHPEAGWLDDLPDWSPDGRQIAYQHCDQVLDNPCSVWTVSPDGGAPKRVRVHCREGRCNVTGPGWTPDGRLVVSLAHGPVRQVGGEPQSERSELVAVDPGSGKQRTILARDGWAGDASVPQVSPDGKTVSYTRSNSPRSSPPSGKAVFAVGIDGSGDHQVTPWKLRGGDQPVFSPEGRILSRSYDDEDEATQSDYWTVLPDGSELTRLTHFKPGTLVLSTSYSPDGGWIAYASDGADGPQDNADVYVMRAGGTGGRALIRTEPWDSAPDWGPPEP
jgi:Tol biopolymer transport system component